MVLFRGDIAAVLRLRFIRQPGYLVIARYFFHLQNVFRVFPLVPALQ
jgi:hypothetical protein